MGDAADDLYEAEMEQQERLEAAKAQGVRPCPVCGPKAEIEHDCPKCGGLGWVDKHGEPTEI